MYTFSPGTSVVSKGETYAQESTISLETVKTGELTAGVAMQGEAII